MEAATARPEAGGRLPVKRAGETEGEGEAVVLKEEGNCGRRLLVDTEKGVTLMLLSDPGVVNSEGLGEVTASPRPLSVVEAKLKGDAVVVWI